MSADALVHFIDRDRRSSWSMQQSCEFADVPSDRLQHNRTIVFDDEIESCACLELQMVTDALRNCHLPLGREGCFRHGVQNPIGLMRVHV